MSGRRCGLSRRRTPRRLTSIFEHTPVGVAILRGPTHVFEFANREYLAHGRPTGLSSANRCEKRCQKSRDKGCSNCWTGSTNPASLMSVALLNVMLDRGGAQPEETFFDFVYQPLTEDGRVTGIAAVCFEVTELAKARRDAELANRAKDEFLAMLGHELRNPLAPILTALQLMNLRGVTGPSGSARSSSAR